jgi:hypothetical protein
MNAAKHNAKARDIRAKFFPRPATPVVVIPERKAPPAPQRGVKVYTRPIGPLAAPKVNPLDRHGATATVSVEELRRHGDRIIALQCAYFSVSVADIRSRTRLKQIVTARQACVFHLRAELDLSWRFISDLLGGGWDHSTMMHAYRAHCERVTLGASADIHGRNAPLLGTKQAAREKQGIDADSPAVQS